MRYSVSTAGTFDAIDLSDARMHLKIPSNITAEDDLIRGYIRSATKYFETKTNHSIPTSTWVGYLDEWPESGMITINKNPVTSISSIKYYDEDNTLSSAMSSGTDYIEDTVGWPARIWMIETPSVYERPNAIEITFVTGYSSLADVDDRIKNAIRLLVAECEQDRASYVKGTIVSRFPRGFESYANQFRIDEF